MSGFGHIDRSGGLGRSYAGRCPPARLPTVPPNAKILTVDSKSSTAAARAIQGDRILAVGSTAGVRKIAGAEARVIGLGGRPGESRLRAARLRLGDVELADLAVLSKDDMTVRVDQVGGIASVLTMVGGKIVYAAAPFTNLESK